MYRLTKFKELALISIVALLLCYGLGLAIPVPAARGDVIITVSLHFDHVGTSSIDWPSEPDTGGLTDPVVWHFVLNQAGDLAGTATQTTSGGETIFANLPMGTYEVYKDTVLTGFVTVFDPGSTATLEQGGQEVVITITNTWENGSNERYGRIIINKSWVGANAGAVHFLLYEGDALIAEGDTAADQLIFEGLMPGEYRIVENTPAGYTSSIGSGADVVVIPGQDAILAVVNTRNDDGDNPGDGNEPGDYPNDNPGEPNEPTDADEPDQPAVTVVETTPTAVIPTVTELIPETTALGPPAVEIAPEEPAGLPKTGGNGMTALALMAAMLAGSGITLRRTSRR